MEEILQKWRLASHIRACRADGVVILLDMLNDKYISIQDEQNLELLKFIEGWPGPPVEHIQSDEIRRADELFLELRKQGIITNEPQPERQTKKIDEPSKSVEIEVARERPNIEFTPLLKLWKSALSASLSLKYQSLSAIEASVINCRIRSKHKHSTKSNLDLIKATNLYLNVRPFAFSAHDRCLHDSLTLIRFLANQGFFPRWIIGVRTRPFGAHSWVQDGDLVLNDLPETVRRYEPILIV